MKFVPRDEFEREAFDIEPPQFDIGQRVRVQKKFEGGISEITLRTVDWPVWLFQIDGRPEWYAADDLE